MKRHIRGTNSANVTEKVIYRGAHFLIPQESVCHTGRPERRVMSQNKKILAYMQEYGGITSYEAYTMLRCTRLPARIHELRKEGHVITKKYNRMLNSDGRYTQYCEYRLDNTDEQQS